jgi:hypothetical protein
MALPNHIKAEFLDGNVNARSDTLRVALVSDNTAYTFDPDTHEFVDDVLDGGTTAEEFAGTGYNRQGLSNVTVTQDDTDDEGVIDADNTVFTGLDGDTIQAILVYKQVGGDDTTPGDDPIVVVLDDDSAGSVADLPQNTNGGDITIEWDTEGVVTFS